MSVMLTAITELAPHKSDMICSVVPFAAWISWKRFS
jgi:hypothetical protein